MKRTALFVLATILSVAAIAQNGKIRGKVTDAADGSEIPGANVYLKENFKGGPSDLDGNFTISGIAPGTYTLVCSFISYDDRIIEGVEVTADEVTVVNVDMGAQVNMIEGAIVIAKENRASVNAINRIKATAPSAMDGVSAAAIKENGDNNVAAAAKRVTGVSIEGGKYVYVRGLSDRYSMTTLNGAIIPGLDPNRNSVQLDMFPSALIQNMMIAKAFTPDLPASFTGGLVNIETKDFPEEMQQTISFSAGYNTNATFNSDFLTYEGGKLDWLGMDDGSRAIPDVVLDNDIPGAEDGQDALLAEQSQAFSKVWDVQNQAALPNVSFGYTVGNQIDFDSTNMALGFNAAITYNRNSSFYSFGNTSRYLLTGDYEESNILNVQSTMTDSQGEISTLVGGLLNTSLKINNNNKVGLVFLRNQGGTSTARYQFGRIPSIDPDDIKEQRSLRYLERSMTVTQLKGEHRSEKEVILDWIVSFADSKQDTPDLRTFDNDYRVNGAGQTIYDIDEAAYLAPNRYFREMAETNLDLRANLTIPVTIAGDSTKSNLKIGGSHTIKNRDFIERRYEYGAVNSQFEGDIDAYFSNDNMDVGSNSFVYVQDLTDSRNTYEAEESITGAYAMLDFRPLEKLRVVAGARAEDAFSQATSQKFFEQTDELERSKYQGTLDNLDILPSVNLTFSPNDSTNWRVAYTRTLARPTFRELAPFASFDFETRYVKIGNPGLERTLVDNIDVRYEIYPRLGEIISFSGFYKRFTNPIELVINPMAANVELSWQNQSEATVYGAEMEIRKGLDVFSEKLEGVAVGVNFTYVYSETQVNEAELEQIRAQDPNHPDTRVMFGQSPYIANAILQYKSPNDTTGWSANLTYNVSGPKMALVVGGGTPNVFDMPRHDINVTLSKKISENTQIRFRARNLLNAENRMIYQFKDVDYDFQTYDRGRTFTVSISSNF